MCAIDDCDMATVWTESWRVARKPWTCEECARTISAGESYRYVSALFDGHWGSYRRCAHCMAAGAWMGEVCGGYPIGMLREELTEHWHEGYRSVPFARLIVGQKRQWHDGRDPIPTGVVEMATKMLREQVAW
jgi:hypothetical protein